MSVDAAASPAQPAQDALRATGAWVGVSKPAQALSGLVSDLAAEPLAQLRQLTACCCGAFDGMHSTHCLAEYCEDVEVLAALVELVAIKHM